MDLSFLWRVWELLESSNHRICWVGRDPWGSLSTPSDSTQGNLKAKQCIVQMLVEHHQAGTMTTSLENLFEGLTFFSVKNFFLISNLNFSWWNFESFPCVPPERSDQQSSFPLLPHNEGIAINEVTSQSPLSWTNLVYSATPRKSCPLDFSSSLLLSFGHIGILLHSHIVDLKTAHSTQAEATAILGIVGQWLWLVSYTVLDESQGTVSLFVEMFFTTCLHHLRNFWFSLGNTSKLR